MTAGDIVPVPGMRFEDTLESATPDLAVPLPDCQRSSSVPGRKHRLGRFAPRDQHGRPPQRGLGVRELARFAVPHAPGRGQIV